MGILYTQLLIYGKYVGPFVGKEKETLVYHWGKAASITHTHTHIRKIQIWQKNQN